MKAYFEVLGPEFCSELSSEGTRSVYTNKCLKAMGVLHFPVTRANFSNTMLLHLLWLLDVYL